MCGRYTSTVVDPDIIAQAFDLDLSPDTPSLAARYNIAPTQDVITVVKDEENNTRLAWMRWGLIPFWAKDPAIGNRLINARSETLAEKPSFRAAYRYRRCLVVADGFYEWKGNDDGSKTPYYIRLKDGGLFGMSGLWEVWTDKQTGEVRTTCTIITTSPNELVQPIHNRMTVILPREHYDTWLDRNTTDTRQLQPLLQPYPAEAMTAYPVSTRVNNPRHEGPELIEPVA
jgi:putative SOS response-associated peptidase YedK